MYLFGSMQEPGVCGAVLLERALDPGVDNPGNVQSDVVTAPWCVQRDRHVGSLKRDDHIGPTL